MSFILTLSCPDRAGIVATVSSWVNNVGGFILESSQFGDHSTKTFFMRVEFSAEPIGGVDELEQKFSQIKNEFLMDSKFTDRSKKPKVLVMVSRERHCFNSILHYYSTGGLDIDIPCVVSNHQDMQDMAGWHDIPYHHLPMTHENKPQQEQALLDLVDKHKIDVIVLARYMQILSSDLCAKFPGRIINIHHSFLPSFKGANPYKQAYERGVKIIGATAHYVTSDLDEGPIIDQETHRVDHAHKPEDLKLVGQDIECSVLSRALRYHTEQRVLLNGNKTVIFK